MGLVKVAPDGDCLFHALALHERSIEGSTLRTEVADFLERNALAEPDEEATEAWLEEADHLRGRKEDFWGGHTSIVAYSLMRAQRVFVHIKQEDGSCTVLDASHASVPVDTQATHVLRNGDNHYDCLVVLDGDLAGFTPAWEQPPPPTYLTRKAVDILDLQGFPSLDRACGTSTPPQKKARLSHPRPAAKRKSAKTTPAAATSTPPPPPCYQHRRYYSKTTPPPELQDSLMDEISKARVAPHSACLQRRAEEHLEAGLHLYFLSRRKSITQIIWQHEHTYAYMDIKFAYRIYRYKRQRARVALETSAHHARLQ